MTQNDKFGAFVFCLFMESTCNVADEAFCFKSKIVFILNIHFQYFNSVKLLCF